MIGPTLRLVGGLVTTMLVTGCLGITTDSKAPLDIGAPGRWTAHAPLPTARQEVAVAALGDRVFVIGGLGELGAPLNTVEAYRPATDAWETIAPLPAEVHHAAAVAVDGRLFVLGGYLDRVPPWRAQRTVYEYDAARNGWTTRAPMLIARGAHAATVLGGRIHVVGGSDGPALAEHEVYDPAGDRWSRLAPMPTARDHLAAVAFQGRLWAIGGRSSFLGTQYDAVEVYDPATDAWQNGPPLPQGRGGLAAVALADRVFVFGGESPFRIFNANEMYEDHGKRWIGKDPMPTARHGIGAAVVGNRIWIAGGATQPGTARTNVNEAYSP
jgi:N-acetylneuraminic acid mutarotase